MPPKRGAKTGSSKQNPASSPVPPASPAQAEEKLAVTKEDPVATKEASEMDNEENISNSDDSDSNTEDSDKDSSAPASSPESFLQESQTLKQFGDGFLALRRRIENGPDVEGLPSQLQEIQEKLPDYGLRLLDDDGARRLVVDFSLHGHLVNTAYTFQEDAALRAATNHELQEELQTCRGQLSQLTSENDALKAEVEKLKGASQAVSQSPAGVAAFGGSTANTNVALQNRRSAPKFISWSPRNYSIRNSPLSDLLHSPEAPWVKRLLEYEVEIEAGALVSSHLNIAVEFALTQLPPLERVHLANQVAPPPLLTGPALPTGVMTQAQQARLVPIPDPNSPEVKKKLVAAVGGEKALNAAKGSLTPQILLGLQAEVNRVTAASRIEVGITMQASANTMASMSGMPTWQGAVDLDSSPPPLAAFASQSVSALTFGASSTPASTASVTSMSQSLATKSMAMLPPENKDHINGVYGNTGGFPDVAHRAFGELAVAGARRVSGNRSAINPDFAVEATVVHRNQLVLSSLVHALALAMDAPHTRRVVDTWLISAATHCHHTRDPGLPTPLSEALKSRKLHPNVGQMSLLALKQECYAHAPPPTASLLRSLYNFSYAGQGALGAVEDFLRLTGEVTDTVMPPPGASSHGALGEPELLQLFIAVLVEGYTDDSFAHSDNDCQLVLNLREAHSTGSLASLADLVARLTEEVRKENLKPSTKKNTPSSGTEFALGARSVPPEKLQAYKKAAWRVKSSLKEYFEDDASKYIEDVHVGGDTVTRWRAGTRIDKETLPDIFKGSDRANFWTLVNAVNPKSQHYLEPIAKGIVRGSDGRAGDAMDDMSTEP